MIWCKEKKPYPSCMDRIKQRQIELSLLKYILNQCVSPRGWLVSPSLLKKSIDTFLTGKKIKEEKLQTKNLLSKAYLGEMHWKKAWKDGGQFEGTEDLYASSKGSWKAPKKPWRFHTLAKGTLTNFGQNLPTAMFLWKIHAEFTKPKQATKAIPISFKSTSYVMSKEENSFIQER